MTPELTQKVVQHLLSERAVLNKLNEELDEGLRRNELTQLAKCEYLLMEIEKETTHGTTPDQRPQAPAEAAGGDGK